MRARDLGRSTECAVAIQAVDRCVCKADLEVSIITDRVGRTFAVVTLVKAPDLEQKRDSQESAFAHEIIARASDGILAIDKTGAIVFCNAAAADLFDRVNTEMIGTPFGFPFSKGGDWTSLEVAVNGEPVYLDMKTTPVFWQDQDATLVTLRDVTQRYESETIAAMHLEAMDASANGIFVTDTTGQIKWVNRAISRISGYSEDELIESEPGLLKSDAHESHFFEEMWDTIGAGRTWQGQIVNRHKDGRFYTAEQSITPINDNAGRLTHYVAIQEDITERLKAQTDLVRLAGFDSLTDLPNRNLFMDRLDSALDRATRANRRVAVMVMDLDHFKDVNNTLGHDVGDQLIVTVTERIQRLMRNTDTMSRLGGDEFGILLEDLEDTNAASRMVRCILETFDAPIEIADRVVKMTASIGISVYPEDKADPLNLLRHAELAMYRVKSDGGQTFQYFDQAMDDEIRTRVSLERDLREAIKNEELWLAYQAQVNLETGAVIGAEALLRWNHPKLGFVPPDEFIPVAEASGLILPIGDWIIEEICRQTASWRSAGMAPIQIGINVSGHQFEHRELGAQVLNQLEECGLDIDAVDLEITETVAMERTDHVTRNVDQLVEAGVSISMDDFGTGYSSLSNLQAFPVRRLKIDGSFVSGIGEDQDNEKIVEAVIGLGHSLGLTVIAEGVETEEQVAFLQARQCDEIQGYLVSKPLSAADFEAFLSSRTSAPSI
ncbi:MAG: EAL domain-containing protein [Alphaproteobacteria bacterium]|nr:EAL domain-containing protein [Alphaproteobacteria bacterium]